MRNEERRLPAPETPDAGQQAGGKASAPRPQEMTGVAGQLRPYCDVRAGFEPWRRVALLAWAGREESLTVY